MVRVHERGFLMAEVLLTVFFLSILGMVVIGCMSNIRSVDASAHRTVAVFLAQKQLACVKGKSSVIRTSGEIPWQDADERMPIVKNGIRYMVETTVSTLEDRWRKVIVAVKWREAGGERKIYLPAIVQASE